MISKTNWNTVRVGDIAKVISGHAFKSNEFQERGISVIKIKNIRKGFVDLTDPQHIDKKVKNEKLTLDIINQFPSVPIKT